MLMHHIHFPLKIFKGRGEKIFWPDLDAAVAAEAACWRKTSIVVFKIVKNQNQHHHDQSRPSA